MRKKRSHRGNRGVLEVSKGYPSRKAETSQKDETRCEGEIVRTPRPPIENARRPKLLENRTAPTAITEAVRDFPMRFTSAIDPSPIPIQDQT